jgi:hypothetical protein
MTSIQYTLTITTPDEIDPVDMEAIEEDASGHDVTLADKVSRFISGYIQDAENKLADALPDGWDVEVQETRR